VKLDLNFQFWYQKLSRDIDTLSYEKCMYHIRISMKKYASTLFLLIELWTNWLTILASPKSSISIYTEYYLSNCLFYIYCIHYISSISTNHCVLYSLLTNLYRLILLWNETLGGFNRLFNCMEIAPPYSNYTLTIL